MTAEELVEDLIYAARVASEMVNPFVTLYIVEDGVLIEGTKRGRRFNFLNNSRRLEAIF